MNDKPTGEWTGDNDGVLLPMHRFVGQYAKEIAEAHNAALAAEKAREEFDWGHVKREYLRLQKENAKLEKQLDAEREKREQGEIDAWATAESLRAYIEEIRTTTYSDLEKQLAAEREAHKLNLDAVASYIEQNQQLKQQLAAEREIKSAEKKILLDEVMKNTELQNQLAAAVEALKMLRDYQNGCPLPSYEKGWTEAMAMADAVLEKI